MTQSKLTWLGYFAGIIVIVSSIGRWTFYYSELKPTLVGAGMGFFVLGFAYLYQRVTELMNDAEDNQKELQEDLDGLGRSVEALKKWTVDEVDKLKTK